MQHVQVPFRDHCEDRQRPHWKVEYFYDSQQIPSPRSICCTSQAPEVVVVTVQSQKIYHFRTVFNLKRSPQSVKSFHWPPRFALHFSKQSDTPMQPRKWRLGSIYSKASWWYPSLSRWSWAASWGSPAGALTSIEKSRAPSSVAKGAHEEATNVEQMTVFQNALLVLLKWLWRYVFLREIQVKANWVK